VIGSDVGADRFALGRRDPHQYFPDPDALRDDQQCIERRRTAPARRRAAEAAAANVDLLNWHAFDRAIRQATISRALRSNPPQVPRLPAAADRPHRNSLRDELARRLVSAS
jgi:hypothetical protein